MGILAGEVECGELGEDHDTVSGVNQNGTVTGPGGTEAGEDAELAGQRVASEE